jgi:hypothetical protein
VECPEWDDGALIMAQPDDFKLIREIVAAGGHKKTVDEFDRPKYQRLVVCVPKTSYNRMY